MLLLKLAGWKFHNDPQNSIVVFKWYYYCSFSSQFSKSLLLQFCLFFFCWYWKKHAHLFLCLTTAILRFMWNWLIFYTELKALTILKDINTCCYTALRKRSTIRNQYLQFRAPLLITLTWILSCKHDLFYKDMVSKYVLFALWNVSHVDLLLFYLNISCCFRKWLLYWNIPV